MLVRCRLVIKQKVSLCRKSSFSIRTVKLGNFYQPFSQLIQMPTRSNMRGFFFRKSCDFLYHSPQLRYPLLSYPHLSYSHPVLIARHIRINVYIVLHRISFLYVVIANLCSELYCKPLWFNSIEQTNSPFSKHCSLIVYRSKGTRLLYRLKWSSKLFKI